MMEIRHFLVLIKTEELVACLIGFRKRSTDQSRGKFYGV